MGRFEELYNYLLSYGGFHFTVTLSLSILVVAFLLPSLPFFLFQFFPQMDRFKLQTERKSSWREQGWCALCVLASHTFIYVPAAFAGYTYIFKPGYIPFDYQSIPHWSEFIWKPLLGLVMEDTWHYWNHRLLHHPRIYGYIHKVHHRYKAPFAIAAEYAHPVETIWLGLGFFIPLTLFTNHLTIGWAWLVLRLLETTDVHSGYYFPYFNPLYLLPGYGGSPFHDFHHKNFTGNFGSTFIWWDKWFGTTDQQYQEYIKDLKAAQMKPTEMMKRIELQHIEPKQQIESQKKKPIGKNRRARRGSPRNQGG